MWRRRTALATIVIPTTGGISRNRAGMGHVHIHFIMNEVTLDVSVQVASVIVLRRVHFPMTTVDPGGSKSGRSCQLEGTIGDRLMGGGDGLAEIPKGREVDG